ncbi:MAG: translocation/assembly module TamB domain-containing protein, partial [Thermoanaerobaculales bacterium]|nr:translocation/assembly module TamB domain-containing protein [Thermoanaerobaculales bacterium]
ETFDLTSAVLGGDDLELAADDPLHDISLDISVRGRSGVKVDNNLGRFDVAWDVLRIEGSAAEPRIHGSVRIAPGGVIGFGGREIKVRRGTLEFTGDPAIDPIMEIVPESDMTLVGGEGGDLKIDPTLMATRGLAQGLSSVLGFENETLRPAEIAGQIERDPSVNFLVGQRLNPNLALFLSANLTDVQDRMTMLQGWNFRGLRGLIAQVYQETVDDNAGVALFQRFSWGGTAPMLDRPEIYRLKLEGDWPMSKRQLKKATRLRRGQPFDPFLLFVASVRMERAMAANGYQNARVTAFQEGDDRSPTLVFYCEPGAPQFVRFVGEPPPRHVRSEVTSMYQPPPLETESFEGMRALVTRYFALQGFPDAAVTVERLGDLIVVSTDRGQETKLEGPYFDGLPLDVSIAIGRQLGSANVVAAMANRPESLATSVERRLASFGYLSAKVQSVKVVPLDPSKAEVRIDVEAGPRETIDAVVLVGSDPLGLVEAEIFGIRVGQPLDREAVDTATRSLRNAYIAAGYREARARSEFRSSPEGEWVVDVELEPGRMRLLRNVEYSGLKHTSPRVLDKGVTVAAGEVLTDQALDRSASQIANFSPIERVEVRTRDVGVSEVDVEFDVVEKDRWAAEIGGGWSTERGVSASFGLRDDDLFGRGAGLNLRGGWGSTEQKFFLIGSLPPVPGGRLSLITTVGYVEGDAPDEPNLLSQQEKLASFEVSYALANRVQGGLYYRYTDTRTFEKEPDPFFPLDIRVKIGTVGVRTVVDHFDNLFDPRRGYGLTSDLGWSSQTFGSDLDYVSWLSNFSLALAPFSGATWLQTARLGVAEPLQGQNLVRDARFFAGGQASIRGFDLNSVGPVTLGFEGTLVPAGGGALFILNEELRIPVWGALRFAVFADIGQVWPTWRDADFGLSVGAGVGLRWSTPIGPLWVDVAWPVADVGISSKKMKFYLGIGRPF